MVCISVHMITYLNFLHNCSKIQSYYSTATEVYSEAENAVKGQDLLYQIW